MKGILVEPGKEPVVTTLPDSLWAIENRLGTRSEMIVLPRTPAVLFVGRYDGPIQPASLLNRTYRGRRLYGPILCYGWKGNNIQPMSKDVQAEMLDRLNCRPGADEQVAVSVFYDGFHAIVGYSVFAAIYVNGG